MYVGGGIEGGIAEVENFPLSLLEGEFELFFGSDFFSEEHW